MDPKYFKFIFFFLFCIGHLKAQDWSWAVHAGGSETDNAFSAASDNDGNLYITGFFGPSGINFGSIALTSAGGIDVFIAKYDPDGEVVWARSAGGSGDDVGYSIAIDPSGNICVAGSFIGDSIRFGTIVLKNNGNFDFFVAKYDGLGNLLWAKAAGGTEQDDVFGITTDKEANIYFTGQMLSSSFIIDQDTIYNSSIGFTEMFIVKFDAGGNFQWARTATGSHNDVGYSVTAGSSDDIYVTGFFRSLTIHFSQELLINTSPAREMFITKYSSNGEVIWAKKAGSDLNDLGYSIRMIADDIIGVTGTYRSDSIIFGNIVLKNTQAGTLDFFATQYDTAGQVITAVDGGGSYDDYGWCGAWDISSSYFLSGGYQSESITLESGNLINSGDSTLEIFIIKYHPDGYVLWAESIGGVEDDYINWMVPSPDGGVYVVGYFESPSITIGNNTFVNIGQGDLFIAKLESAPLGVKETFNPNDHFTIYPNPARESFTIEIKDSLKEAHVEIYNYLGEKIYQQNIFGSEAVTEFHAMPGVYFITLTEGNSQYVEKLIISQN